ncbi:TraR/DksA family transcriptional regulator [Aeromonas schubertii]|uniref:Phage protein n=1 Tax=Aeromonas schubertii TaxID=652 RepID=A0A0S2SK73_9GAMM|nr:TraR/DksA family transcriptional regulator [Aeromonas schubertii]ALP42119.1 phage protein [Aeromonas schubertii]
MDDIDRANRHAERMLTVALANQVGKSQRQGESLTECEECDDPIPEGRRRHVSGVRLCITCQTRRERLRR